MLTTAGIGGGGTPSGTQHWCCVFRKRGVWDKEKVGSSVLFLLSVQHLLLPILVLLFLNEREVEDHASSSKAACTFNSLMASAS